MCIYSFIFCLFLFHAGIKYTINKKAKEVVYEEFPLEDVKIESNPSYGVPSARTTSIANPQVVEEKGQNTEVKTEADYI